MDTQSAHTPTPEQLAPYEVAMEQYSDLVAGIAARLQNGEHRSSIDGYIASGDEKHAFCINTQEGTLVAKFLHNNGTTLILRSDLDGTPEDTRTRTIENAAPILAGTGADGLEQLLAVDLDQGIMVTTYAPGKRIPEVSTWELLRIDRSHLRRLANTLAIMRERGLHPHNAGGILWDVSKGFTIVDYEFTDTVKYNKGSIDTVEDFLEYALRDFRKYDALEQARIDGNQIPSTEIQTPGLRSWVRNHIIKQARSMRLN